MKTVLANAKSSYDKLKARFEAQGNSSGRPVDKQI